MLTEKRENPMSVRSKNALSRALLKLMIYKPLDEIAISDITARANLSRQTFYTNFDRKEDILVYLLHGLFRRYLDRLTAARPAPEELLIDYFLFWDDSRDFLSLLFRRNMGCLFQDCNRAFFVEDTAVLDGLFHCEPWQLPYIKASLAGVSYELLYMWIAKDQGLPLDTLTGLTRNLLNGALFELSERT